MNSLLWTSGASAVEPDPVVWPCKPGMADDPCEIEQDTTEQRLDGTRRVYTPVRLPQDQRPVDCFYVYPTVSNQLGFNATKAKDPELYSIAKDQASRFSSQCRMFVPVYRQAPLAGIATLPLSVPKAYADVRDAWREYLANDNNGRGVVLIGHSQGTLMLRMPRGRPVEATSATSRSAPVRARRAAWWPAPPTAAPCRSCCRSSATASSTLSPCPSGTGPGPATRSPARTPSR
ncbi:MAG: DUF3089 domain-containing protein [Aeromicrobium sp.]